MIGRRRLRRSAAPGFALLLTLLWPGSARGEVVYSFSHFAGSVAGVGFRDGIGPAAHLNTPDGVALDAVGNVYVADRSNHVIRRITPAGVLVTLAGLPGQSGSADGPAPTARFNHPADLVLDRAGNIYVADGLNATIRKITPYGTVTTFAGVAGMHAVVDGTGAAARLFSPTALAIDAQGNLYVAEPSVHVIRKITPAGLVSTLAGAAQQAGSADGVGSAARFNMPTGVAIDASGTLYVADNYHGLLRRIATDGTVTTLAGSPDAARVEDGAGAAAKFRSLTRLAVDGSGNIYASNDNGHSGLIRKITPTGVVTTLAGVAEYNPIGGSTLVDGPGAAAHFNQPQGLAVDVAGNIYVADRDNAAIRKVTATGVVSTLAGGIAETGSADGPGLTARFSGAGGIAVDRAGNVFVSDLINNTVRKIAPSGDVSTLAGSAGQRGTTDGTGSAARFYFPEGLVVDANDNIFVSDSQNNTVRRITPTGEVTTWAGAAGQVGTADGPRASARFYNPQGLAIDGSGVLYVSDSQNYTVRRIGLNGDVSTLAGSAGGYGGVDGTGAAARFKLPWGLDLDAAGNLYVADPYNAAIRKILPSGTVTTFAGVLGQGGSTDGLGAAARLGGVYDVALDAQGNLFFVDNQTIRKITPAGLVTTIGGAAGVAGVDDGIGASARFTNPIGIAVDGAGQLYISSLGCVVKGVPIEVGGPPPAIDAQTLGQFVTTGADARFSVSVTNPGGGGTNSGLAATRQARSPAAAGSGRLSYRWQVSTDGALSWSDLANDSTHTGVETASLSLNYATRALNGRYYRCIISNEVAQAASIGAVLAVEAGAVSTARLVNIATRAYCSVDNKVTIGGFVVSGSVAKRVLVRAVGPTLTAQGIGAAEVLLDPTIEVHDAIHGNSIIATNDNWGDNANAAEITSTASSVGATALLGSDTKSAAVLLTLAPGVYSFIVNGKGSTSGIVLLEVYDADSAGTGAIFANIATRAQATTGNGVTIGGFVISGNASKQVLLRAVGPTLTKQGLGVAEVLTDPTIELHDAIHGNAIIGTNDNWGDNPNAASITTTGARIGATPLDQADTKSAALLVTLQPGVYSFIASGKSSTSGIVLVEVYDAD